MSALLTIMYVVENSGEIISAVTSVKWIDVLDSADTILNKVLALLDTLILLKFRIKTLHPGIRKKDKEPPKV